MKLRLRVRPSWPALLAPLFALLLPGAAARAQGEAGTAASQVYRCPGPPVLYTDAISPRDAAGASAPARAGNAEARVEPTAQRQRDSEARRILQDELRREEEKLAVLQKDYNKGEPERRGDERNYQRYLDRVAEMKAAITRKEADIAALKREIAKLPAP
jgi:hypothetical protein